MKTNTRKNAARVKHLLSKSTYIRSLQCLKSLFLYKFHYRLRDPLSPEQKARFDKGHAIGKQARDLFPGGVDVSPPTVFQFPESVRQTQELINKGWPVLYEAAFQHEQVLAALDILVKKDGSWFAFEVKSSYSISDTHLQDAALQYHIITGSGLKLEDFRIIFLDNSTSQEVSESPPVNFREESVLDSCIAWNPLVRANIQKAKEVIEDRLMPDIAVGDHCYKPYPCDFIGTCWKGIKSETPPPFNLKS